MGEVRYRTVSWYLHSMNFCCDKVSLHSGHGQVVTCTPGKAITEYGYYYVDYVVLSSSLDCMDLFLVKGEF